MLVRTARHPLFWLLILFSLVLFWTCQGPDLGKPIKEPFSKLPKQDRIDLAIQQEFELTKDPNTGTVPRERLWLAKTIADRERAEMVSRGEISGITWTERGPDNIAGRTRAILVDANDATHETVWAASVGGGLWKTTSISSSPPSWTAVDDAFDNMAITAIAQDTANPNTMYFGTGEGFFNVDAIRGAGIWKTTDGGTNWSQLSATTSSTYYYITKLVINSSGTVFAGTRDGGVMRSTDGGTTWSRVLGWGTGGTSSYRVADIEIAADGDIYVAMGLFNTDGIYKSTDNGGTWTQLTSGLPGSGYYRIELACAPSDADVLYALYQGTANTCSGIYRTADGGSSWSTQTVPAAYGMANFANAQAWYNLICAVDPADEDRVFIGGIDLLLSTNGGTSWTQISQWYGGGGYQYVHADQHSIVFAPGSSDTIFFGNDGGIFRSVNGSAATPTISSKGSGYNVTQYYACAMHPDDDSNIFLAGAQDNGSHRFTTAGINSVTEVTGGDGAFCHIDQDNPDVQISSYVYNYYWITTNSWSSYSTYNVSSNGSFINPTDYDDAENKLYACYTGGNYARLDGIGATVSAFAVAVADFGGGSITHVAVSPTTTDRVFFGLSNGRVVRVDNADTGSPTTSHLNSGAGMPTGSVSCIAIEDDDDDHLLVTYSSYGVTSVWETTNGGTTWTNREGDLPDMPVRWALFHPMDSSQAILATELGVWTCDSITAASPDWAPSISGLANVRVDMLQIRPDYSIAAATHGRGLFTTSSLARPEIDFNVASAGVNESSVDGTVNTCVGYDDVSITVDIESAPLHDLQVDLSVDGSSTAETADYDWVSGQSLTFSEGSGTSQTATIRIYNDGETEGNETIVLTYTISNSKFAQKGPDSTYTLTISDDNGNPISGSASPEATLSTSDTHELGPNETVDFYNSDGDIIARIQNLSAHDYGCTTVSIDRAGSSAVDFWDSVADSNDVASKTVLVSPTTNNGSGSYTITLFYTSAEVTGWETVTGKTFLTDAEIIKNPGAISNITPGNNYPDGPNIDITSDSRSSYGGGYYITGTFNSGFSGFGMGDPDPPAVLDVQPLALSANVLANKIELLWQHQAQGQLSHFVTEKSTDGQSFQPLSETTLNPDQLDYRVLDQKPSLGWNYYRLRMVFLDGSFEYSNQVSSWFAPESSQLVGPNPFNEYLDFDFVNGRQRSYQLRLMNLKAELIAEKRIQEVDYFHWDLSGQALPRGIYLLEIKDEQGAISLRKLWRQ